MFCLNLNRFKCRCTLIHTSQPVSIGRTEPSLWYALHGAADAGLAGVAAVHLRVGVLCLPEFAHDLQRLATAAGILMCKTTSDHEQFVSAWDSNSFAAHQPRHEASRLLAASRTHFPRHRNAPGTWRRAQPRRPPPAWSPRGRGRRRCGGSRWPSGCRVPGPGAPRSPRTAAGSPASPCTCSALQPAKCTLLVVDGVTP